VLVKEKEIDNRVLITGSSGFIGRLIIPFLQSYGFYIRGYDCQFDKISDEFVEGRIEDTESLRRAVKEVDGIIHLAAFSDEGDFLSQILVPNIIGVYSLFEAIKDRKIKKIILASSIQVAGINNLKGCAESISPIGYYSLSKLWLEKAGEMNSRLHNLNIIAARLGWIIKNKVEFGEISKNVRWQKFYLSHADTRRFFLSCLASPFKGFHLINAVTNNTEFHSINITKTKNLIGFQPEDPFPKGLIYEMFENENRNSI
jgi:uronate dehydrogenase